MVILFDYSAMIHRIMQKGIFGHNSNGMNGKRHSMADSSVIFSIYFPNGDTFEEKLYMKEPLAQQLTRIINEFRRQGSMFMKKKYYYHALHPVDLLIIDEDHKFIPNDRPPGNWPTIVKSIMQERKPVLYVWSFKFSEKDKVSFPDVAHLTEPPFFSRKSGRVHQSETTVNLPEVRRSSSVCALSPPKLPIQLNVLQSAPKAKPRLRNSLLINSTSQLMNSTSVPPIPPKTKCSSMTCIDEQIINSCIAEDTFERHFSNGAHSLTPQMKQLSIKRSTMVAKSKPMLPPPEKFRMKINECRADYSSQPVAPLRNSSARKTQQINSFILPTDYDGEFSDDPVSTPKFLTRDFNFYNKKFGSNCNTTPSSPTPARRSPLLPPKRQHTAPELLHPTPIQSYKYKRDQSMDMPTLPRMHNTSISVWESNENDIEEAEPYYSPIVPAIPPKSKHLPASKLPVAMPRKRKPEESKQQNLSRNIFPPQHVSLRPYSKMPSSLSSYGDSFAYPSNGHTLPPLPQRQKKITNGTTALNPMIPSRMKTAPHYPIRY